MDEKIKKIEKALLQKFSKTSLKHVDVNIVPLEICLLNLTSDIYLLRIFITKDDCLLLDENFDKYCGVEINSRSFSDIEYPLYLFECKCYFDKRKILPYCNACYDYLRHILKQYYNVEVCCFQFIPDVKYTRYQINKDMIKLLWRPRFSYEAKWIFDPSSRKK